MNTQITSKLTLIDEDTKLASPTAHLNALEWIADTAVSWTLDTLLQDQMARDTSFYRKREEKRQHLLQVLAYAMDRGLPAQTITGSSDKDLEGGLINEAITKELHKSFKEISLSEEQRQLLIDCDEDPDVIDAEMEAKNMEGRRIATKRRNSANEREAELRKLLSEWFRGVYQATAELDNIPSYILRVVSSKYDYALQAQRKYCKKGIGMGNYDGAGELKQINKVIAKNDIKWIHDRIDELDRQSNFDDSGEIEKGMVGDDERKDITY